MIALNPEECEIHNVLYSGVKILKFYVNCVSLDNFQQSDIRVRSIVKQTFEMLTPKSNFESNNSDILNYIKRKLFRQSLCKGTGEHFN
jgi:hypothetical protein